MEGEPHPAALHPEVEMHPERAAARDIVAGSWVMLKTPIGTMRARARLINKLDPRVVVGEHGWWQACDELGEPGHDPFSVDGSNFNATVDATRRDPIGGTPAHRGNVCEVEPESATSGQSEPARVSIIANNFVRSGQTGQVTP